ncbi:MAG: radical SAM protein [Nitrospinae bacterium]|nr:radical SAM protein [Nitrospinota bacterium]
MSGNVLRSRPRRIEKILFIAPPLMKERVEFYPDFPTPPLGIAYVMANLEGDYKKEYLDLSFHESWEDVEGSINRLGDYDMYAFTSMTPSYAFARRVAERIRTWSGGWFVIGGSHVTVAAMEVMGSGLFDIGVLGEGERTFSEIVNAINNGERLEAVPGVVVLQDDGAVTYGPGRGYINGLDSLSYPARGLMPMEKYLALFKQITGRRGGTLISSRGCPFGCAFCSREIFGRKLRHRSPGNVAGEIETLMERYGVDMVHFVDDTLTANRKFTESLCATLQERQLGVEWQCESRVDCVSNELLETMKSAGLIRIMFGVESGDEGILNRMGKGITPAQVIKAFDMAHKAGLEAGAFIMLGYPGETRESLSKTVDIVGRIKPDLISVSFANALPGTRFHEEFATGREGGLYVDYHLETNVPLENLSFGDLDKARSEIFDIVRPVSGSFRLS